MRKLNIEELNDLSDSKTHKRLTDFAAHASLNRFPEDLLSEYTLADAINYLNSNYQYGCKCPTCGSRIQEHERSLNQGLIQFLKEVVASPGKKHAFYQKQLKDQGHHAVTDYAVLKYWRLTTSEDGIIYSTENAIQFLEGNMRLPEKVYVLQDRVTRYGGDKISIYHLTDNPSYNGK